MSLFRHYVAKSKAALIIFLLFANIAALSIVVQTTWAPAPWWGNGAWNFRKSITVSHTLTVADLTNFPVLLDFQDGDLSSKAQSSGNDIVFVDAGGNKLNHEIELYDEVSGHLVAWVKIPLLSSAVDTVLYMYYGNPSAVNQQNASGVWDSDFKMVQHMEELSGIRYDSTTYGNNAAVSGVSKDSSGKIDGADTFAGGGNEQVPAGFLPSGSITVELWLKPKVISSSTWVKYVNTGPTSIMGIFGGENSKSQDRWTLSLSWNSGATKLGTGDIISGFTWNYIVVTWNGSNFVAYRNGAKLREVLFSGTPDWVGRPLYLGTDLTLQENFIGSMDEVRISSVARSAAWIQACYNTQNNASAFYTVQNEEISPEASAILFLNVNPPDGAASIYTNPTLSASLVDLNGLMMTVIFQEYALGVWTNIKTYVDVPDGTYNASATRMKDLGTNYLWRLCVTDGGGWANATFGLTTTTNILTAKWTANNAPRGASGVLIADIDGDGKQEIVDAGQGGVVALNGTDGSVIWTVNDSGIGNFAQPQMADLNKDGIMEIVIPREGNSLQEGIQAGLLILRASNHAVLWNVTGLGRETYSGPVIQDIDGSGYPTIFFVSTDVYAGLAGTGKLVAIRYDPSAQNFAVRGYTTVWRPCGGGLSIADIDGSGEFRLFMGDRNMYLNSSEYGDNDYGKGVQSYWARNLTLIWSRPDVFCSSQKPMLADVYGTGKLQVVVGDMNGGVYVINATDGSTIKKYTPGPGVVATHYQPSICDIDGDGHVEFLAADPHFDINDPTNALTSEDIVIVDLVTMQVKKRMYIGLCFYGPQEADVTGDGLPEIIADNYNSIIVFDKTGRLLDGITGLSGILNYAVAQDIDGDGYTELVASSQTGFIYAFDTPARTPAQRVRTEIEFYSEYRRGVAEYVQPLVSQRPVIYYAYPTSSSQDVPVSLSTLQFTLTDYQYDPMNYTVTTYPHIGGDSKKNVGNGPYSVAVSGLAPSTTYTWVIYATDGFNTTNATFTFTTQTLLPWSKTGWNYRKAITINHLQVISDLHNFPVLVSITSPDLSKALANGNDIMFTDSNGSQLNHEIEFFNQPSGYLVAWIKVESISSNTDTVLYMYYGNPSAVNQQNASGVWDSNYKMVQHMEELSGTRYDSTIYGNNAAVSGVTKDPSGKIDGADAFAGNGYEQVPAGFLPSGSITVELWLKPTSISSSTWTKYINAGPTTVSGIYGGQSSKTLDRWTLSLSWNNGATQCSTGDITSGFTWNYIVVTWDQSTASFVAYRNGVQIRQVSGVTGVSDWTGRSLYLGTSLLQENFNGSMDEVRISSVARSAAWIQACYSNQNSPSAFYSVGSEETIPVQPIVYDPTPANKAKNISASLSALSFYVMDYQNDVVTFTVTTYPYIGTPNETYVGSGMFTVPVSNVQNFVTYQWNVSATDGIHWTNVTYTFSTLPNPPTQGSPSLAFDGSGNLICSNQTTNDPAGYSVANIYHWYKNGVSTTNLLMPFDTDSTNVKDYSGYSNNGAIVGNVAWTSNGKVGGAYNFNGGYITVPGTNVLDGGGNWQEITVEQWIYLTAYQENTRTVAKLPSYEIGISGSKLFGGVWIATGNPMISGYNRVSSNTVLELNTWYHIALTYKSGIGLKLYINGQLAATSGSIYGNIQSSGSNALYLGWFEYFKGRIDEVQIYPKCLSSQQILQRYQETANGLSTSSIIVTAEITIGDIWRCEITPSNTYQDGLTSSSITITR